MHTHRQLGHTYFVGDDERQNIWSFALYFSLPLFLIPTNSAATICNPAATAAKSLQSCPTLKSAKKIRNNMNKNTNTPEKNRFPHSKSSSFYSEQG